MGTRAPVGASNDAGSPPGAWPLFGPCRAMRRQNSLLWGPVSQVRNTGLADASLCVQPASSS
jgi:hypothetical protein